MGIIFFLPLRHHPFFSTNLCFSSISALLTFLNLLFLTFFLPPLILPLSYSFSNYPSIHFHSILVIIIFFLIFCPFSYLSIFIFYLFTFISFLPSFLYLFPAPFYFFSFNVTSYFVFLLFFLFSYISFSSCLYAFPSYLVFLLLLSFFLL